MTSLIAASGSLAKLRLAALAQFTGLGHVPVDQDAGLGGRTELQQREQHQPFEAAEAFELEIEFLLAVGEAHVVHDGVAGEAEEASCSSSSSAASSCRLASR